VAKRPAESEAEIPGLSPKGCHPCRRSAGVLESPRLEYGSSGSLEKWASPTFLRISQIVCNLGEYVPGISMRGGIGNGTAGVRNEQE
jgi:hypothetical protein